MAATTETMPRAFDPASVDENRALPATPGWDLGPERRIDDGRTLANALAWASFGLGAVEVLAGDRLCRFLGMEEYEDIVRLMGLREIATGIGILSQKEPTAWIAARIGGDVLDLALLGVALSDSRHQGRVLGAIGAIAGITALDVLCHRQLTSTDRSSGGDR